MRRCGWCWRTTATTPPAANPERGRGRPAGPGRVLRPRLRRGLGHQPGRAGPRRRRPGRGRRPERRGPGRPPSGATPTGQLRRWDRRAAVLGPGAAVGPGRPGAGAGAQLGSWTSTAPAASPRGRMGERPRIDPEAVRQAQPGEAWVIQAGQSIHLRVLPRRRWRLSRSSRRSLCRWPTTPSRHPRSRSRFRSGSRPRSPWPLGRRPLLASSGGRGGCDPSRPRAPRAL